jgi:hypothetical protein
MSQAKIHGRSTMKRRILGPFAICITIIHFGSSTCSAADVPVMYAIGLLDNGENAKVLPTEEFNQSVTGYNKFRDRVAKAPTLKAMGENGWTIPSPAHSSPDIFRVRYAS